MRFLTLLSTLPLMGCSGGGIDDSGTNATTETGTCWWCVDTATDTQDSDSTTEDTGKSGKEDTGKGEKEDTGKSDKAAEILSGTLAASTGLGELSFNDYDLSAYCSLTLQVESAEATDDCEECEFAYTLQVSTSVNITKDGGGCDPGLALAGTLLLYGHGADGALWIATDSTQWSSDELDSSKVFGDNWNLSNDITHD